MYKEDAEMLFASCPSVLTAAADALVALVSSAAYDGLQLDIEGLRPQSKAGF